MQFVKTEDLKIGMRLARPIYSKKGVLLFERNSRLSAQAVESVRNFGLLGIYILEPAEPLPPMTQEDLEFERFQTMMVSSMQEELGKIIAIGKQSRMQALSAMVLKEYGQKKEKIKFYQNLRSRDDYVCKHALNVSILCALMTHRLNISPEEQLQTIYAAMVHDIGKIQNPNETMYGGNPSPEEQEWIYSVQMQAGDLIESAFDYDGVGIRRVCMQALRAQKDAERKDSRSRKMVMGAKILLVANRYDEMTAMSLSGDTKSEVKAIQELMENCEIYAPEVVNALTESINILFPGVSVELSTGEKALVLADNPENILRPMVLGFKENNIIDLSLKQNEDIHIVDIMKTLDNRCIMDPETLKAAGFFRE